MIKEMTEEKRTLATTSAGSYVWEHDGTNANQTSIKLKEMTVEKWEIEAEMWLDKLVAMKNNSDVEPLKL